MPVIGKKVMQTSLVFSNDLALQKSLSRMQIVANKATGQDYVEKV